MFLVTPIANALQTVAVFSWDFGLTVANLVTPSRKVGHVTPAGEAGADGKWPEYIAPKEGDSRCSCPALNALANHGAPSFMRSLVSFSPNVKIDRYSAPRWKEHQVQ